MKIKTKLQKQGWDSEIHTFRRIGKTNKFRCRETGEIMPEHEFLTTGTYQKIIAVNPPYSK